MRLRNFSATTMDEAMHRVRQELGEDAIILSTRRDGKHGVLVTAGLEDEPLAAEDIAVDRASPVDLLKTDLPRTDTTALEGLDRIAARLEFNGVPAAIADRLLNAAAELSTENPTLALAAALDAQFTFAPLTDNVPARPLLFIGPPGVGKTSSLAKLAIRARLAGVAVGAVTCYMLRGGAEAQLATYTSRLDIPAYRARDGEALVRALASLPAEGLRLIDSAGSNPQSDGDIAEAAELVATGNAEPILVLAAGGDPMETADQARIYAQLGARRLIVTKLDTVRRLGSLLAAAAGGGLALCEFGLSPQISDGLVPMNPVSLARLLMGERIELPSLYPAREAAE
jgi:flagellar biosynthesis protein FlhF